MADQKISQLTTITTVDNAADLFPIVDSSASETKKITPTALKSALALNNVDNTSDANKPISSATQTALDAKMTGNTAITGATKTKITYDSKGLVTAGADATTADIADSTNKRYVTDAQLTVVGNTSGTNTGDNAVNSLYSGLATSKQDALGFTPENVSNKSTSVTTDQASNTKYPSVKAVYDWATSVFQTALGYTAENTANKSTSVTTDQASNTKYPSVKAVYDWAVGLFATISSVAAKQDTLVSGTNIKTINSTTLLGSGNLSVAPASGIDATAIADGSVTSAEFQYINSLTSNAQTQIDSKTNKLVTTNRQTASYTLVLGDADKLVEMNVGSANNLTIPLNSSVAFATGTQILLAQYGAGQTTIVPTSGVTIRSNASKVKLNAQYSGATLIKIDTNEWYLFGDIA